MTPAELRQLHEEARMAYGHMLSIGQGIGALDRKGRDFIGRHDEVFGPASEPDVLAALLDIAEAAEAVVRSPYVRDAEARTVQALDDALARLEGEHDG